MYKNYKCPVCNATQYFPSATAPYLQPACTTLGCLGRLVFESETPYPPAPIPPPVITQGEIDYATRPVNFDADGTFCSYRVVQDRKNWKISFTGKNKETGKEYALTLEAGEKQYNLPKYNPDPTERPTATSEIFVLNARGELDWEPGPSRLAKYNGPPPRREVISSGHEAILLTSPIRLMFGSQDVDNQHSGSGLIHLMFSHDRETLQGVQDFIHGILFPTTKIKAVYRTAQPVYGYNRFIILGEGNVPHQVVLEGREGYLRLITAYKGTDNIRNYNKFKKPTEYVRLYCADTSIY